MKVNHVIACGALCWIASADLLQAKPLQASLKCSFERDGQKFQMLLSIDGDLWGFRSDQAEPPMSIQPGARLTRSHIILTGGPTGQASFSIDRWTSQIEVSGSPGQPAVSGSCESVAFVPLKKL